MAPGRAPATGGGLTAAVVLSSAVLPIVLLSPTSVAGVVWPLVVEAVAVAVLVLAASRMPSGARLVWLALAGSQALTLLGDLVYDYQQHVLGQDPFPGWSDPVYLASYGALGLALVVLTRSRHPRRDREQALDAAIMTLPLAAVVATFVILPMLTSTEATLTTLVGLAYPVLDLVLLAGLIRLLVGGGRPSRALALVAASVAVTLVADLVYNGLAAQGVVEDAPGWVQALFTLAVLLMATAGRASDAPLIAQPPSPDGQQLVSSPRLVALGLGTMALPVLLASGFGLDVSAGVRVLALASILVNLLVVWRAVLLVRLVRRQRDELSDLARTDPLTGIPNRRSWEHELERRAAAVRRTGHPAAVAVLDLDHFKRYNDAYGHQAGDRLLVACAAAWAAALPEDAYLARYGGEEFAVIVPATDLEGAVAALDVVRRATPDAVTVSAGVVLIDPDVPAHQSVATADAALYRAKAQGRDRVAAAV